MDRLPPEPDKEDIQKEIKRRIEAIMDSAAILYDLLEPGMTVEVKMEESPAIIMPNKPPRVKRLYITRPACCLEVGG